MNHRIPFSITFFSFLLINFHLLSEVESTTFKIVNRCRRTIWPGILTGANRPQLNPTGFALKSGKSRTLRVPNSWSGRIWARTECSTDPTTRKFACATADCGSGTVECAGAGATPPATLAEFTLNGDQGLDFYDVSLVDGYNIPMLLIPKKKDRSKRCSSTGCLVDLNGACPRELSVTRGNNNGSKRSSEVVACKSACEAFGDPMYCCSEEYGTPDRCSPSVYSLFFKHACPRSYSYAYDDKTSTFTCAGSDYIIIFCPLPYTSNKFLTARKDSAELPLINKTMLYLGRHRTSLSSSPAAASANTFTFVNKCSYTVWPGILANAGSSSLGSTGFELPNDSSHTFTAPTGWSGRFWGRTGCSFPGSCQTGDCGSGEAECNGSGAAPPATLAEFTLAAAGGGLDFYDVSLVDGYNLPMIVEATGGSGTCESTGCVTDLNRVCPSELRAAGGQACKSACEAFGSPEYCCSGTYNTPATCRPSVYSQMFKSACPRSYSYAYDDPTSTFTCAGADYTVTFCPSTPSQKSSKDPTPPGVADSADGSLSSAHTNMGDGSASNPETVSGSGSQEVVTDGSWLAGLAMGDSIRVSCPLVLHCLVMLTGYGVLVILS